MPSDVIWVTSSPSPPLTRYSDLAVYERNPGEHLKSNDKGTVSDIACFRKLPGIVSMLKLDARHEHTYIFCWHHVQLFDHVYWLLLKVWCCICCITNCLVLNCAGGRLNMSNIYTGSQR